MQFKVIFKGIDFNGKYVWENCLDASPKQLVSDKNSFIAQIFPKKNQQYNIRCKKVELNKMIDVQEIVDHYSTCSYWKVVDGDLVFKKSKNKGLTLTQYTSSFPFNPEEEKSFVKSLSSIYRMTHNIYTRNNIMRIFNSGVIKYCEVFGYGGSIILSGSYRNMDMLAIGQKDYKRVKNRLEYFASIMINPITQKNCGSWVKYLDGKFF